MIIASGINLLGCTGGVFDGSELHHRLLGEAPTRRDPGLETKFGNNPASSEQDPGQLRRGVEEDQRPRPTSHDHRPGARAAVEDPVGLQGGTSDGSSEDRGLRRL